MPDFGKDDIKMVTLKVIRKSDKQCVETARCSVVRQFKMMERMKAHRDPGQYDIEVIE